MEIIENQEDYKRLLIEAYEKAKKDPFLSWQHISNMRKNVLNVNLLLDNRALAQDNRRIIFLDIEGKQYDFTIQNLDNAIKKATKIYSSMYMFSKVKDLPQNTRRVMYNIRLKNVKSQITLEHFFKILNATGWKIAVVKREVLV